MKIYDISQELLGSQVFPGNPVPQREILKSMDAGLPCNLSALSLCAHNGTHVDAPYHFVNSGRTVDRLELSELIGQVYVAEHSGDVTAEGAYDILRRAGGLSRILIKGKADILREAAAVFAEAKLKLMGNESQTVGPEDDRAEVHRRLLGADMVLLEGVRLGHVPEGEYILCAAPINIAGCDGAPCRAVLLDMKA